VEYQLPAVIKLLIRHSRLQLSPNLRNNNN